jgi:hypothetical protein
MNTYRCLHVLEVDRDASPQEVKQAYFDMVYMWHPDRVPPDMPELKLKAENKLKDINAAYDHYLRHVHGLKAKIATPTTASEARSQRQTASTHQWDHWVEQVKAERASRSQALGERLRSIGTVAAIALLAGVRFLEWQFGANELVQFVVATGTILGMFTLAAAALSWFSDAFTSRLTGY